MAGEWIEERMENPHSGGLTIESWTQPLGGIMLGTNLSGTILVNQRYPDGSIRSGFQPEMFEFMRIAPGADGRITFFASPNGEAAIAFPLVRADALQATFENPAHDYPQRITYRRMGDDQMHASISRLDGSRGRGWLFRRWPPPAPASAR